MTQKNIRVDALLCVSNNNGLLMMTQILNDDPSIVIKNNRFI